MKKTIIFTIVALLLYNNYEYINEIFFLSNLSKYELNCNKTYNYDLNEDGNLEEIKLETYKTDNENYVVNLYINNELKYEYTGGENLQFYIYDFNKFDKIKELCITSGNDSRNYETNIFMYNKDNSNNFTIKGKLINNDEKVGVIKVAHASTEDSPIFENFSKILGGEHIYIEYNYKRIQACEVLDEEKKEVNVSGNTKEKEYIAQEEIVVYETNKGNVKAYTLSKGDKVKLRSLYSYEQDKYIKVVNEEGRYGWIKLEDNQILE